MLLIPVFNAEREVLGREEPLVVDAAPGRVVGDFDAVGLVGAERLLPVVLDEERVRRR